MEETRIFTKKQKTEEVRLAEYDQEEQHHQEEIKVSIAKKGALCPDSKLGPNHVECPDKLTIDEVFPLTMIMSFL